MTAPAATAPMTFGQRDVMFYVDRVPHDKRGDMNQLRLWPVPPGTSRETVAAVLRLLAERHESLRTRFVGLTQIVDPGLFNGLFSTHAAFMIFLFVIPVFAGLANYVLPLMIGAPDMAFPRLNALSFWMLPMAGLLFLGSYLAPGGAFDAGWTGYAPLSTGAPLGQSFFNLGVQFAGASSVATALKLSAACEN